MMRSESYLKNLIASMDGKDYCEYETILGSYQFKDFTLFVDQIPKDPYAPEYSGVYRLRVKFSDAGFSERLIDTSIRKITLGDYLVRRFYGQAALISTRNRGTGNSGWITIEPPGQTILARSAIRITKTYIEVRFFIGLPAIKRCINARLAEKMLFEELPIIVEQSLFSKCLDMFKVVQHIELAEDVNYLRGYLSSHGLIGFISDGSLLPRRSGVDNRPLDVKAAIAFKAPESLRLEVELPNQGKVTGMCIKKGITIIVGGGYHGKSTLLKALELGIYTHIPNDGREFCVTVQDAVKIRAYSGRSVSNVDISLFLNNMPNKIETQSFSTKNASGSTSQAASIMESIESGAKVLLMDEDTCALNFLIRDKRMQELVTKEDEPITSFRDCIKFLYQHLNISTVLVMGGSGEYFDVADCVIQMKAYLPYDVTQKAKTLACDFPTNRVNEAYNFNYENPKRRPLLRHISPYNSYHKLRIYALDQYHLTFGSHMIDLSDVEQLVEKSQIKAIGHAIKRIGNEPNQTHTIKELLSKIMQEIEENGMDALDQDKRGDLSYFRGIELACAINRIRNLKVLSD